MKWYPLNIVLLAFSLGVIMGGNALAPSREPGWEQAMQRCQTAGYSAGHVDPLEGIVCEQWKSYAKIKAEAER